MTRTYRWEHRADWIGTHWSNDIGSWFILIRMSSGRLIAVVDPVLFDRGEG